MMNLMGQLGNTVSLNQACISSVKDSLFENHISKQRIISQNLLNSETQQKAMDDLNELKATRPNWLTTFQNK